MRTHVHAHAAMLRWLNHCLLPHVDRRTLPPAVHVKPSCHPYLYSVTTLMKRRAISPITSNSLVPLLCFALCCRPLLCLPWLATAEPLPSPSKMGERLTVVASSTSTELELEPSVIDARWVSSPGRLLLPCGSPSTTVLRPPPSQSTVPRAPSSSPELTDPRFHSGNLSSAPPMTASPLSSPSPSVSYLSEPSTAPPRPTSRRRLAGIGR
jgi:hypothetical protein